MRGEVLYFDGERGMGFIAGDDGNRYAFSRDDTGGVADPAKGSRVEFEPDGGNARRIVFPDRPAAASGRAAEPGFRIPDIAAGQGAPASWAGGGDPGLFGYFRRAVTENYVNFRDRARRKEYWGFVLFSLLAMIAGGIAGGILDGLFGFLGDEPVFAPLGAGIVSLALLLPGLAVTIRRIHDIGLSGWFVLVGLIPTIGNLILLVFALIPSQKHDNRWGPVPQGA